MDRLDLLQKIKFGERIAEEETEFLQRYFVTTENWRRLFEGEVDVIYGSKGSGKSALYSILDSKSGDLFDKKILLTTAENPRGNTVFEGLTTAPPTSEIEFIRLWKLYFLIITTLEFKKWEIQNEKFDELYQILENANLVPKQSGLKAILRACREYISKLMDIESITPAVNINEQSGAPSSFNLKISFREPNNSETLAGVKSIEYLYELLEEALQQVDYSLWIAVDRLDVAFSENFELEANAIRALFKTYRDLTPYSHIKIKIFLRDDIWRRIIDEGFREASHITKTLTISWNKETLVNLIVRRCLSNEILITEYGIDKDAVLNDYKSQEELFYRLFPDQIEGGSKRPKTFEWIMGRVQDGKDVVAPREIVHLLNESKQEQIRRIQNGQYDLENENIIGRNAFKNALSIVSKVRLEQTIFAEYPTLKIYIQQLKGAKTEQQLESLSNLWEKSLEETKVIAGRLVDIGFFQERGEKGELKFWVPFLYRSELSMIQGLAE